MPYTPHSVTHRDGTTFDLKKVALMAETLEQEFLREPETFKPFVGAAVFHDPSDLTKRYMLPLEAASWLLAQTCLSISVPMVLVASGACASSEIAMPTLIDLLSGKSAFVEGVAKLHGVEPATYAVLSRILYGHLEVFGPNFVAGVIQESHYGEERERNLDSLDEVVQFVLDNWLSSDAGGFLPTDGLTVGEVDDILATYMADCGEQYANVENFLEGFEH